MWAGAKEEAGLPAQANDDDNASAHLGRWKACLPLSTDGTVIIAENRRRDKHPGLEFCQPAVAQGDFAACDP